MLRKDVEAMKNNIWNQHNLVNSIKTSKRLPESFQAIEKNIFYLSLNLKILVKLYQNIARHMLNVWGSNGMNWL